MPRPLSIRVRRILLVALGFLGTTAALSAHDMWIEPTTFAPQAGEIIGVKLRVGQDLLGDPIPRDTALINQFIVEDAVGRKPVVGRDGADPAGYIRAAAPGVLVVGYRSNQSRVELNPEIFNKYLKDEGLDAIAQWRAQHGAQATPARELFSRCAKSLLLAGRPSDGQADRLLGFTLELLAERNPYTLAEGQDLPVRLTYENKPLAGALVIAMNRSHPNEKISVRTDENGRVRLRLRPGGMWLIKAVHMIPAPAGTNADWVSFWASLTFDTDAAAATASH